VYLVIEIMQYIGRFSKFKFIYRLIKNAITQGAEQSSRNPMPGAINSSKYNQIILSAEKIKVATYNIPGFEQNKTVGEAFPDVEIIG
jgi:hypothetical protein